MALGKNLGGPQMGQPQNENLVTATQQAEIQELEIPHTNGHHNNADEVAQLKKTNRIT
jgi:hypothetical protein